MDVTDIARTKILTLMQDQLEQGNKMVGVRLTYSGILPMIEYRLAFVEAGKEDPLDEVIESNSIKVFVARHHRSFLSEVTIDFIETLQQTGFKVDNPKVVLPEAPESPPELDSPEAIAVKNVLDMEINPAVASHGGYIRLIDVKDHIAYIQMGGGCQGCGTADVTLKQGVVAAIKKAVPEIIDVLDVTDHRGGQNPYFPRGQ